MSGLEARFQDQLGAFTLDVEMRAPATGVTGLFGASASGKTTVLRCLAGLHRPAKGSLHLNGTTWQDDAPGTFLAPHARGVGYVSQAADLFPHLTVRGNLEYAERRAPPGAQEFGWDDVVEWLDVRALLDRAVANLSGGERQRVAIARALLARPLLLLMDEPVSALDEPARREALGFLEQLLARLPLPTVYVSHALTEVARLADHLVWIRDGRIADSGPVSQVLGRLDFARWWGDEAAAVLEGTVGEPDLEYDLTPLSTPLGSVIIHRRPEPVGATVRVQVYSRDVSIGLTPQHDSSILNELQLSVLGIADASPSSCLVQLGKPDGAGPVLLARVTRKSRVALGLTPGLEVYARVKSVAVLD